MNRMSPSRATAPWSFMAADRPTRSPDAASHTMPWLLTCITNASNANAMNAAQSASSENRRDSRTKAKSTARMAPVSHMAAEPRILRDASMHARTAATERPATSALERKTSPPTSAPRRNARGAWSQGISE
jgi:hypothetical protein